MPPDQWQCSYPTLFTPTFLSVRERLEAPVRSYKNLMRSLLLLLARQKALRRWMETSRLARPLSARFIAGMSLAEALATVRAINAQGMSFSLDHLGEDISSLDEAVGFRNMYIEALGAIQQAGMEGNVSLKLSQFGLDLSPDACRDNVRRVVCEAARVKSFVRIDMESSAYTDRTLEIVKDLHRETGSCGAVIQSYLHRSEADIEELNRRRIRIRLCKGAYLEPAEVAFQAKSDVDGNFVKLMRKVLSEGNYPGIATHDERMIEETLKFAAAEKIGPERFEFQMLYGVRRDLQKRLRAQGWGMRVYVPFGEAWYPYFMRRLAERPANVLFVVKNFFKG
jgi:proline dehydrogenase